MLKLLFSCMLRNNTLQGIGQTNDLQLIIYPQQCDDIHNQQVEISLQIGNIKFAPNFTTFNSSRLVFKKRISPELFQEAKLQSIGNFQVEFDTGEVILQSFTKLQFTNQNLTNCWENITLAYSVDKHMFEFEIEAVPAQCQFAQVVTAKLIYFSELQWHEVVIESGGSYNSQNYSHMQTTGFQRACIGVFSDEEIANCFAFLNKFQTSRDMQMKLVIDYLIGEIEVSVQEDILYYYTPNYQNCMDNLGMTLFITYQSAVVNFKSEEFLLCNFLLNNPILTMEIQLNSRNFSYNQKRNFSISETLYFPQASFYFEEYVKPYIFAAEQPLTAHYFLSIFESSGSLVQQASYNLQVAVSCFNYINFTISKDQVCANMKFNQFLQCRETVQIPVTFKGLWVVEDAPPLSGELLPVFEISQELTINFSQVEQKICIRCNEEFIGGNCRETLIKYSKFYVQNPMYVLIGIESFQNSSSDYMNYQISFSTDIYLDVILFGQILVAAVFLVGFSYFLYRVNRKEVKEYS